MRQCETIFSENPVRVVSIFWGKTLNNMKLSEIKEILNNSHFQVPTVVTMVPSPTLGEGHDLQPVLFIATFQLG
jgi:hypothetical protein